MINEEKRIDSKMEVILGNLVHFKKNGEPGEPYPLFAGQTTIGAHRDADIRLKTRDPNLEHIHSIIEVNTNGTASLVNKSERDPVRINGVVVRREQILKPNDIFEVCSKKFQYRKCVPSSAHKTLKASASASKKRYTLVGSATKATRLSFLTKTPQAKKVMTSSELMKNLSRSVPRKSTTTMASRSSRKLSTTFETHSLNTSTIKPDIKNASNDKTKSKSMASMTLSVAGSSRASRRLSLSAQAKTISPQNKLANIIHLGECNIKRTPRNSKISLQTSQSPVDLIEGTPATSMKRLSKVTPKNTKRLSTKMTPNSIKRLSKVTPKSTKRLSTKMTPNSIKRLSKVTPQSTKRLSKVTPMSTKRNSQFSIAIEELSDNEDDDEFTEEVLAVPLELRNTTINKSVDCNILSPNGSSNSPKLVRNSSHRTPVSVTPNSVNKPSGRMQRSNNKLSLSSHTPEFEHNITGKSRSSKLRASSVGTPLDLEEFFERGDSGKKRSSKLRVSSLEISLGLEELSEHKDSSKKRSSKLQASSPECSFMEELFEFKDSPKTRLSELQTSPPESPLGLEKLFQHRDSSKRRSSRSQIFRSESLRECNVSAPNDSSQEEENDDQILALSSSESDHNDEMERSQRGKLSRSSRSVTNSSNRHSYLHKEQSEDKRQSVTVSPSLRNISSYSAISPSPRASGRIKKIPKKYDDTVYSLISDCTSKSETSIQGNLSPTGASIPDHSYAKGHTPNIHRSQNISAHSSTPREKQRSQSEMKTPGSIGRSNKSVSFLESTPIPKLSGHRISSLLPIQDEIGGMVGSTPVKDTTSNTRTSRYSQYEDEKNRALAHSRADNSATSQVVSTRKTRSNLAQLSSATDSLIVEMDSDTSLPDDTVQTSSIITPKERKPSLSRSKIVTISLDSKSLIVDLDSDGSLVDDTAQTATIITPKQSKRSLRISHYSQSSQRNSSVTSSARKTRSNLTQPPSPVDSLIVNVDSDTSLADDTVHTSNIITPKERKPSLDKSKISTITLESNLGTSANDSAAFTTPENNVSVVEISDIAISPKSPTKGRRSKSFHTSFADMNSTPKNIPQEDAGFKTPLTTPAVFEKLKNSALRSRKRLHNSVVKSIKMCTDDEESGAEEALSDAKSLLEETGSKKGASRRVTRSASSSSLERGDGSEQGDVVVMNPSRRMTRSASNSSLNKSDASEQAAVGMNKSSRRMTRSASNSSLDTSERSEQGSAQEIRTSRRMTRSASNSSLNKSDRSEQVDGISKSSRRITRCASNSLLNKSDSSEQGTGRKSRSSRRMTSNTLSNKNESLIQETDQDNSLLNKSAKPDRGAALEKSISRRVTRSASISRSLDRSVISEGEASSTLVTRSASIDSPAKQESPVRGVKRGRESEGSVLKTSKKARLERQTDYSFRETLNMDASNNDSATEDDDEGGEEEEEEAYSSGSESVTSPNTNPPDLTENFNKVNRSRLSLALPKQRQSVRRRSLQNYHSCADYDKEISNISTSSDHSLQTSSQLSQNSSSLVTDEVREVEVIARTRKSSVGISRNSSSVSEPNLKRSSHSKSAKEQKSPLNDLSKIPSIRKLLQTPRERKSPRNDLSDIRGIKRLMKTPGRQRSPKNDLTDIKGVKKLMGTPRQQRSPKNDLRNIGGVKKLMSTPKEQTAPHNDLTDVAGVKQMFTTPKTQNSPRNDLTDVAGVKQLLLQKSPRNDLRDVRGVKQLMKVSKTPKNDLRNIPHLRKLMGTPHVQNEPSNDLSNVGGVKRLLATPRQQGQPKNDLTDVQGVKQLYLTEEAGAKRKSANVSGMEALFQVNEDIENIDLFSNLHQKPLRTYKGKSLTPGKSPVNVDSARKTLGDIPANSPHVQKWVQEQIRYVSQQSVKEPDQTTGDSKEIHIINDEDHSQKKSTPVLKTRGRRKPVVNIVDSPRRTTRRKQLVVEIEPMDNIPSEIPEPTETGQAVTSNESSKPKSRRGRKLYEVETQPVEDLNVLKTEITGNSEMSIDLPKRSRRNVRQDVKKVTFSDKQSGAIEEINTSVESIPRRTRHNAKTIVAKEEKSSKKDNDTKGPAKRGRKKPQQTEEEEKPVEMDTKADEENESTDKPIKRKTTKVESKEPKTVEKVPDDEQPKRVRRNARAVDAEIDTPVESKPRRTRRNEVSVKDEEVHEEGSTRVAASRRKRKEPPHTDGEEHLTTDKNNKVESTEQIEETIPEKKARRGRPAAKSKSENEQDAKPAAVKRGRARKEAATVPENDKTVEKESSEAAHTPATPIRSTRRNKRNETEVDKANKEQVKEEDGVSTRPMRTNRKKKTSDEEEQKTSKKGTSVKSQSTDGPATRRAAKKATAKQEQEEEVLPKRTRRRK